MTPSRPLLLAVMLVSVLLHSLSSVSAALAANVPKDKLGFTAYMQNKLQLYSPLPVNVVGPLSLSVGPANAALALPSLKTLHKGCIAAPSKCDHAVNDYVQDVTRAFLQKPAAAMPPSTQPTSPLTDVWLGPRFVFSTRLGTTKMGSVVVYLMIYVQDMARSAGPVATATPDCILIDGATLHDACMAPIIDLWRSPRYAISDEPTRSLGFENVVVGLTVHADGSVDDVVVVQSSGSSWLDRIVVSQTKGRHYFPATRNGVPVEVRIKSAVRFEVN